MEKFAVDLDAVLDEFEFHEDQANQSQLQVSPSVSGFYSPCSNEPARSSLDLIPVGAQDAAPLLSAPPALPSTNTRYDVPFPIEQEQPSAPVSDDSGDSNHIYTNSNNPTDTIYDKDEVDEDRTVFEDEPITIPDALSSSPVIQTINKGPVSNHSVDPSSIVSDAFRNAKEEIVEQNDNDITSDTPNIIVTSETRHDEIQNNDAKNEPVIVTSDSSDTVVDDDYSESVEEKEQVLAPCEKSIADEIQELSLNAPSDLDIEIATAPLVAEVTSTQESSSSGPSTTAESHTPPLPTTSDTFKDEDEGVDCDDKHESPPNEDTDDDTTKDETAHFSSTDYVDMKEVEQYLKEIEDEKSLECEINPTKQNIEDELDLDKEGGARPKHRNVSYGEQKDAAFASSSGMSLTCGDQFGEDECLIPDSELQETIAPAIASASSGMVMPESPPPYSEVDPNSVAGSSGIRPNRPVTLDLEGDGCAPRPNGEQDDSPVNAGDPVLGAPGETPANPSGPRLGQTNILDGLSEDQLMFGKVQPFWVPDADALSCMICSAKFTVVKRRHHCRSCGKVLCSNCCGNKFKLMYMENKEGRVCTPCKTVLERLEKAERDGLNPAGGLPPTTQQDSLSHPNPSNPMEYCSRIPVADQIAQYPGPSEPPSVLVPVGVLKRNGPTADASGSASAAGGSASGATRQENKSVMFSDGIRPGGDLTELDGGSEHRPLGKRPGKGRPRRGRGARGPAAAFNGDVCKSRMPPSGLPFVSGRGKVEDEEIAVWFSAGTFVNFVLNNNLTVLTKKVQYAPINRPVWNFASRGLTSVGQDEVVILLEVDEDEALPPRDIYVLIQTIYEQAGAGRPLLEMGYVTVDTDYLGSNDHGGWLFIRHTFQAVSDIFLPNPPVLFGLLVMRTEIPWARVFPLRLMLRLGAEYRYYPSPLVSTRYRKPVYREIGHTIMNVLADFKNYAYTLPTIRGLVIHMSPAKTVISIPKNRHEAVCKAVTTSNDPVLALGANFSMSVDSHLVAIQNEADGSYQTQAINILNKERVVTGASFVVFNGSLKSTSNLTAKSSIVEDGIMVQVLPDHMLALRKKLQDMEDIEIGCGPVGAPEGPDETVVVKWVDEDKAINIGIKSFIDGKAMDGVPSLRIHSGPDMRSDSHLIRWTELFLIKHEGPRAGQERDPTRIAEGVCRAVGAALTQHLHSLKEENCTPLAVRITLDQDNVSYEAGADGKGLAASYMNNLDSELVPLLHSSTTTLSLVLELVFHILDT